MEQYLPQCLDSITREDVPDTLEAIIVNDGSTDHSLEIATDYKNKHPDIIKIIDKANGHYGSCINAALKIATGKYFRPLDADDWFDTNALIQFLGKLSYFNSDLIITSYKKIFGNSKQLVGNFNLPPEINSDISILSTNLQMNGDALKMHSMTYSLDLLKKIKYHQQEGICYTDTEYYLIPLEYASSFTFIDIPLYQYRLGREGQSVNNDILKKNLHQLALVIIRLLSEIKTETNVIQAKIIELTSFYLDFALNKKLTIIEKRDLTEILTLLQQKPPTTRQNIYRKFPIQLFFWKFFKLFH